MTKISFFKKNKKFVAIECTGHTGFAESGEDILCATISSICQSGILGMIKVLKVQGYKYKINEDKGYLKFVLPDVINDDMLDRTQILFETMYASIEDLLEGYSKYLLMEVIEDVY